MQPAQFYEARSNKNLLAILVYLILCIFNLGMVVMIHFIYYKVLASVNQHFLDFMAVFNSQMVWVCYFPNVLLLLSSVYLLLKKPAAVPRWAVLASIAFAAVSVIATLFFIMPYHTTLEAAGFNQILYNKLLMTSNVGQILPAILLSIFASIIFNAYFKDTKAVARFIFLLLFASVFYAAGADAVEKYIGYPSWLTIGSTDWMATRSAIISSNFISLYLLPSYLPLLLAIPLFWLKPKGLPKYFIVIVLMCLLEISIVTAIYFVPQLQIKLDTTFSKPLIEELIRNDFPLRGIAELIIYFITAAMFFKSGQAILETQKN